MYIRGGTFALPTVEAATELTDKNYTTSVSTISNGDYTVTADDVTIDASGYTGAAFNQNALFKTQNGKINVDVAAGKTLTIKGFNGNGDTSPSAVGTQTGIERATLYAYNRFKASNPTYDAAMTFTGGSIVVSNEYKGSSIVSTYGVFADNDGKFVFQSD